MSTLEENKAIVRNFIEAGANKGNIAEISKYVSQDFVEHYGPPNLPAGIAGSIVLVELFRNSFEGYSFEIEELLAEGDRVMVRGWGSGKHTGMFLGNPPSGKDVRFRAAHVFQVVDGKITARWAYPDTFGMLQQIGAVPMPGAPPKQ